MGGTGTLRNRFQKGTSKNFNSMHFVKKASEVHRQEAHSLCPLLPKNVHQICVSDSYFFHARGVDALDVRVSGNLLDLTAREFRNYGVRQA